MHEDNLIRNPHTPPDLEMKEAKNRELVQLIQSNCRHRRMGIIKNSGTVLYCQDCMKVLY